MATPSYVETWITGPLSTSFYTRLYTPPSAPPRGAIVFVHGYIEHIGRYEQVHGDWAARGFAVFAYDQRGFGRTALDAEKSVASVYGQTGGTPERMMDVEWAVKYASRSLRVFRYSSWAILWSVLCIFCMVVVLKSGLHPVFRPKGGGITLGFATRTEAPPDKATVSLLSGIIASSPFVRISNQPSTLVIWVLGMASKIWPNRKLTTPVQDKDLSHDPKVGEDSLKDPWIRGYGTMRGVYDMFSRGNALMAQGYKCWPKNLPVLVLHGTKDMVNSCEATEAFFSILQASDKHLVLYPDALHDLMTEPDVKGKYFEECVSWVEARLPPIAATVPTA